MSYIIIDLIDYNNFIIDDYNLFYKYFVLSVINSQEILYRVNQADIYPDYEPYYRFMIHMKEFINLYNCEKYEEAYLYMDKNLRHYARLQYDNITCKKYGDVKFPEINNNIVKQVDQYFKMKVFK